VGPPYWEADFNKENRTYSEIYANDLAWQTVPRPILELSALGLLLGAVFFFKATSPDTFADDLAVLGVFAVAVVQILPSLSMFGGTRMQMMNVLPDVQVAHQVLTLSVPARQDGRLELPSFDKAIAFENVSFAHKDRETLMDEANLSFDKGKVTAIVGPSGSGKTTLVNLILGLFEPSSGMITVDGIPLHNLTHQSWLGRIGFVSQDPFITNNTIEENIRFKRIGHSKETIVQAAEIANAHGFISEFPERYDTVAGDRGIRLSGGQQQRICIARAVLGSPEILIFDEATSSLDSMAEKQVQEAIDSASANRTVIIIAHRLSTIRQADKIIVLDQGKVVEQGTHQELLGNQGHYSKQVAASA
jgi:subfamily B ATP-binding cassette protein MsbA